MSLTRLIKAPCSLIWTLLLILALPACGLSKSEQSQDPSPGFQPSLIDSDGGSNQRGTGFQKWAQLRVAYEIDIPAPTACGSPRRIAIDFDGSYVAGPCTPGGTDTVTGQIEGGELQTLYTLMDAVVAGDVGLAARCDGVNELGMQTVDVTLQSGATARIYRSQVSPLLTCTRGDPPNSRSVGRMGRVILDRVYGERFR